MSTKFKTIFDVAKEEGLAIKEAEANEAKAEANRAKAEANRAKAEANEAKAEANEAKAEANEAKAEANEAKAEANEAKTQANEMKGAMQKAVIKLIQTNALTDSQIAEAFQIEVDFVKNLRLTVKPISEKKK